MMEKAVALWTKIRAYWTGLSTARRVSLLVIVGVVLSGAIAFSYFSSQTRYAYLFTDLSTDDASVISGKLRELKVPFKVDASGTALQVPEEKVHEIRLQLASFGLPRGGGVGFELFDKSQFGATEFEQRVNLRRALEGELARTIGTIAAVQSARVHLVIPESSVFAVRHEKTSASVVLRLRPSRTFSRAEIASVVHLVTAAVPGLTADRVSVVSADGLTLHRPRADAPGVGNGADDTMVERQNEISSALEQHVLGLLERAVGPGHAEVRIRAELDPAARERTEEHYEPSKTALRSEQKVEEHANSEGASVAGVPGAQSNLPDEDSEPESDGDGRSHARTSWTRNWEVDKVTEKISVPAGKVARLSVAVLVDGVRRDVGGKQVWQPRDKQELDRFAELIKGAVAFDAARGDVIQIDTAEFARAPETPTVVDLTDSTFKKNKWIYVGVGAGALLLLSTLVLVRRRKKAIELEEPAALPAAPETIALEGGKTPRALPRAMTKEQANAVRGEAIELATRDPATAAVILREWLNAPSSTPANATPSPAHF